jgi:DNA mismatch endonuclease (patch repair protein)
MADILTKEQRSYNMSRIRSSKTSPELKVQAALKMFGFTYQPRGIYGRPDFANKREKIAIFIDGCFWHGCKIHYRHPKSNTGYWMRKIERNKERDTHVVRTLRHSGWRVIRLWEHNLN